MHPKPLHAETPHLKLEVAPDGDETVTIEKTSRKPRYVAKAELGGALGVAASVVGNLLARRSRIAVVRPTATAKTIHAARTVHFGPLAKRDES